MALFAFAADRRAAVDMDGKVTAPAAAAPCSNRSISNTRAAISSKPAARRGSGARWDKQADGQTDRRTLYRYIDLVAQCASSAKNKHRRTVPHRGNHALVSSVLRQSTNVAQRM